MKSCSNISSTDSLHHSVLLRKYKKINVIWSNSLCVAAQLNFHSLGISLPVKILEKNYGQLLLYGSHTIDGGVGEGGRRFKRVHINPLGQKIVHCLRNADPLVWLLFANEFVSAVHSWQRQT